SRPGDPLHAAPALVVRLQERLVAAAVVLVVAEQEDGVVAAGDEQVRGVLLPAGLGRAEPAVEARVAGVAGDVAGRRDDRIRGGRDGRPPGGGGPCSEQRAREGGRSEQRERGPRESERRSRSLLPCA